MPSPSFKPQTRLQRARAEWQRLLDDTPIEVGIGALAIASVFAAVSYNINEKAADRMPVAFSEIGKTIKLYAAKGEKAPAQTRYYANQSDFVMKYNESRNTARESSRSYARFASELETRIDPALRIHWQMTDLAKTIPQEAEETLAGMDVYKRATPQLSQLATAFARVWDYERKDYTKTIQVPYQDCDAKGQNCTTKYKDEEVYDYSIHKYDYNPTQARQAQQLYAAYLEQFPNLKVKNELIMPQVTDPENDYAIEQSMKHLFNGKIPSAIETLAMVRRWATGNNFAVYSPQIEGGHNNLQGSKRAWDNSLHTARSVEVRRESKSDDGPAEYRLANRLNSEAGGIASKANKIMFGIRLGAQATVAQLATMKAFIACALDQAPGCDADKLYSTMEERNRQIYEANFSGGFDMRPFKWFEVIGMTFLGGMIGGALGYGADRLNEMRRRRRTQNTFR